MIIGLNGFLGSGKDTVYQRMVTLSVEGGFGIDLPVFRVSFADKLKLSAAAALGVFNDADPQDTIAWMNKIKDNGSLIVRTGDTDYEVTGREYLQWYGTEAHRGIFGDDFWVDQALPIGIDHEDSIVCVTDVRFPNEIARVKYIGGEIWNVNGIDNSMSGTHASETPINPDLVDVFISNNIRDDNYRYLDDQIVRALGRRATVR